MKYYAGIDLGGTFIKCGIIDEEGKLIAKDKIPTEKENGFQYIANKMSDLALSLANKMNVKLHGIGIGSPGTVNSQKGVIVYSNNLDWDNVPLAELIKQRINLPVKVTNDANAAAIGEQFCGAGKEYSDMILITLGTGVGSGIVIEGKLFEGYRSAGAEIGHSVIHVGGEKCTCGRRGCFEAYASATALIRQTRRAMERNHNSAMWRLCDRLENVNGRTAFDGLRDGDKTAKRVVNTYIRYLAEGIANLCNEFRPQAVLLGGGICAEGDTLLRPLKKLVNERLFGGTKYAPVQLLTASLGNDAGVYGAARLVMVSC